MRGSPFDGIEHRPQSVELEAQDVECTLSCVRCLEVVQRDVEAVFDIALSEREILIFISDAPDTATPSRTCDGRAAFHRRFSDWRCTS
jgi:hypothetical protein